MSTTSVPLFLGYILLFLLLGGGGSFWSSTASTVVVGSDQNSTLANSSAHDAVYQSQNTTLVLDETIDHKVVGDPTIPIGIKTEENVNLDAPVEPTVFIVLLVRNKAHTLPYFLTLLERLDYPKERIALW